MNRENSKGIFFGILGILTLVIAIMGATLAYFTASAVQGTTPIEVSAATVTISYIQGTILTANELVPSEESVVDWAYLNEGRDEADQCIDAKGYQVCSVFRFQVSNAKGKTDQSIIGTILTTTDVTAEGGQNTEFDNLSYTVYDVKTDGTKTKLNPNKTTFAKTGLTSQLFDNGRGEATSHQVPVLAGEVHSFEIVIWLNELANDPYNDPEGSGNQNHEQGLSYQGTVSVEVAGGSGMITGTTD